MNIVNLRLARGTFGALVVGALGFGATQALASPTQAAGYKCTYWQDMQCQNYCASRGMSGRCTNFDQLICQCFLGPSEPTDP
jgi:hypothetical protein